MANSSPSCLPGSCRAQVRAGFGADGPLHPVPLDGSRSEQPDGRHYEIGIGPHEIHVVRRLAPGEASDLYTFTLVAVEPIDYEVANHYTATHPLSGFVRTLTVQRSTRAARHILRGRTYTIRHGEAETVREIADGELVAILRDPFGIDLPEADARLALGRR